MRNAVYLFPVATVCLLTASTSILFSKIRKRFSFKFNNCSVLLVGYAKSSCAKCVSLVAKIEKLTISTPISESSIQRLPAAISSSISFFSLRASLFSDTYDHFD